MKNDSTQTVSNIYTPSDASDVLSPTDIHIHTHPHKHTHIHYQPKMAFPIVKSKTHTSIYIASNEYKPTYSYIHTHTHIYCYCSLSLSICVPTKRVITNKTQQTHSPNYVEHLKTKILNTQNSKQPGQLVTKYYINIQDSEHTHLSFLTENSHTLPPTF